MVLRERAALPAFRELPEEDDLAAGYKARIRLV
jgi:hypothetical protein